MTKTWETTKLGKVCKVVAGQSPEGKFYNDKGEGTPFYQGKKEFQDRYIGAPKMWTREVTKLAFADDILMSVRAPVGPVNFAVGKICIGRGLAAIRVSKELDTNFLFYFLVSKKAEISGSEGAVFASISRAQIEDIAVPVPPLPEQKRIVAILDGAFEGIDRAIANTEKNLANARELFESYLNSVFTNRGREWTEKTLQQVSLTFGRGKSKHRPRNDPKLYGGPYPFIQTGEVRSCDHVILESTQTYNQAGLAQSKLWPKGTICITIAANIAETGILGFDACFPDSIIGVVVNERETTSDFVEYLLQSVKMQLKAQGKGSAQDNINLATFEDRKYWFPPLDEQKAIVGKLSGLSEQIRQLEACCDQKILTLAELKQSILQKAFAGELSAGTIETVQRAAE